MFLASVVFCVILFGIYEFSFDFYEFLFGFYEISFGFYDSSLLVVSC